MTIRFKLMMASIAVILVANSVYSFVRLDYFGRAWLKEVQTRVKLDLNSARAAYNNHVDVIASFLRAVSVDQHIAAALTQGKRSELAGLLQNVYRAGGMDFVSLLDAEGKVAYRARNPTQDGGDLSANPLVKSALVGKPVSGTIVLSREELAAEGRDLAERARFALRATEAARPTAETFRADGMVAAAAVPIRDLDGQVVGVLYGGDLLNRRHAIVDAIKDEVFGHQTYKGKEIGTVTIFQWDLRISTNVIGDDGGRTVGTRLSEAVYDEVLVGDRTWAAPAFVVNDWYITAYEPIKDPTGRIIGVLYVGLLQAPFLHTRSSGMGAFLLSVGVTTLASLLLLWFVTKLVLHPIGRIVAMSQQVVEGDLSARVGIRPPGEMGVLCRAIDSMADAIADREEQLKIATSRQIGRSEQLAAVGRLAAGVAHEINNPLTGVPTFSHLLREKENMDHQDKQDLDLIIHETTRAAGIVRGLLDFARERPTVKEPLDINEVVRRTIRLLGNQEVFRQVAVVEDLAEHLPQVDGDMNQLQQVLLNLSLNACEAMPNGGTLLLGTSAQDGKVVMRVVDTGCGIKKEHLDRIFEPFFSTKLVGKGTGLGLSVSYGIVQQHGGELKVESQEGKGTTFAIVLPAVESRPAEAPNRKAAP